MTAFTTTVGGVTVNVNPLAFVAEIRKRRMESYKQSLLDDVVAAAAAPHHQQSTWSPTQRRQRQRPSTSSIPPIKIDQEQEKHDLQVASWSSLVSVSSSPLTTTSTPSNSQSSSSPSSSSSTSSPSTYPYLSQSRSQTTPSSHLSAKSSSPALDLLLPPSSQSPPLSPALDLSLLPSSRSPPSPTTTTTTPASPSAINMSPLGHSRSSKSAVPVKKRHVVGWNRTPAFPSPPEAATTALLPPSPPSLHHPYPHASQQHPHLSVPRDWESHNHSVAIVAGTAAAALTNSNNSNRRVECHQKHDPPVHHHCQHLYGPFMTLEEAAASSAAARVHLANARAAAAAEAAARAQAHAAAHEHAARCIGALTTRQCFESSIGSISGSNEQFVRHYSFGYKWCCDGSTGNDPPSMSQSLPVSVHRSSDYHDCCRENSFYPSYDAHYHHKIPHDQSPHYGQGVATQQPSESLVPHSPLTSRRSRNDSLHLQPRLESFHDDDHHQQSIPAENYVESHQPLLKHNSAEQQQVGNQCVDDKKKPASDNGNRDAKKKRVSFNDCTVRVQSVIGQECWRDLDMDDFWYTKKEIESFYADVRSSISKMKYQPYLVDAEDEDRNVFVDKEEYTTFRGAECRVQRNLSLRRDIRHEAKKSVLELQRWAKEAKGRRANHQNTLVANGLFVTDERSVADAVDDPALLWLEIAKLYQPISIKAADVAWKLASGDRIAANKIYSKSMNLFVDPLSS